MKFLQYCHEIDIDLNENNIQTFGDNVNHGYIINNVYLAIKVIGYNDLFCLFSKDENTPDLTADFALSFAQNVQSLIKETHKISQNIDDREIKSCVRFNSVNKQFVKTNYTDVVESFPLFLYKDFSENIYYVVTCNDTLFSFNNEQAAKRVFKIVKKILISYIRRNW